MALTEEGTIVKREEDGTFPKGVSGNPLGRPKGSKNKITLLKQSLELQLREQAAPDMGEVLHKAVELAMEGDRQMIKLLLEMHMSKGIADEIKGGERVAIQINSAPPAPSDKKGEKEDITVIDAQPTEDISK